MKVRLILLLTVVLQLIAHASSTISPKTHNEKSSSSRSSSIARITRQTLFTSSQNQLSTSYVDNRKPAFIHCKDYAPSVKEEQPQGTFVIKVEARDPDDNAIHYRFVTAPSERPKFRIDAKTGEIRTAHTFDRDEPIREIETYITVQATDNGRPPLDDVCTFTVVISDINDNPPVFDKARYDESMSEDTQVNKLVMRISASDFDDGDNSIIKYKLLPDRDHQYFRIDEDNGLIYLAQPIDRRAGQHYVINVKAYNIIPDYHQEAQIEVRIRVVESNKRPPNFIDPITDPIYLKEDFNDYSRAITTLRAVSNVPDKHELIFELVTGRTEQTNSKKTFVSNQTGDTATINLGKALDYEAITDYTLTMSVRNTYDLVAEHVIKIKVEDVNDNIPYFTEVTTGTISENENPGTPVMQVRAFDMDGTEANNIISFELADNTEFFAIDSHTGNITALTTFDREERDFYNVKVIASDNSPSSLYNTGEPNRGQQVFKIEIADKNDHRPHFQQDEYVANRLAEDANTNFVVIEVTALDNDTASQIIYTIENGNVGDAFKIEALTGQITVNRPLDYEAITEYTLKIRAFDGIYDDYAIVTIKIEDVNDNRPVFLEEKYTTTIQEESIPNDCILHIKAYDPDIKDRTAEQYIKYSVVKKEQQGLLKIDDEGCLRLIQKLDRDLPNGHKNWQVLIAATDENGNGLKSITDVDITLYDINDNAPFLTNKMPIIWDEIQEPGPIVLLTASDYDEPENGPPFKYQIDPYATIEIMKKFIIDGDMLMANDIFDREEQKEYFIPILVSDSGIPVQSNVSIFHLVIGDVNDNPMKEGSSKIFVYNYKGEAPDTPIGRVFVDDPDDWDLEDKNFAWKEGKRQNHFRLNPDDGMITMEEGTPEGQYELSFTVREESQLVRLHTVDAYVAVVVKEIPEEAVDKSGSVRFYNISAESFVEISKDAPLGTLSLKDKFQLSLAKLYNTSIENVDVFTALNYNTSTLDVRFSAHGSPYYEAERLNGKVAQNQQQLEDELGVQMLMINIDECLIEKNKCESSCTNVLHKSNVPLLVYTNTTSFVGVNAFIQAECVCEVTKPAQFCLNGGTAFDNYCECIDGYDGPHCEIVGIGFYDQGYALYPPISPCENTVISMELAPQVENGLVMYIGPMNYNPLLPISDFLSLELVKGYPVLTVDYGSGTVRIDHKHIQLNIGKTYAIEIILQKMSIEMTVDNCKLSTCMSLIAPVGPNEFLNVNAPLQLGSTPVNLEVLGRQHNWSHIPQNFGYIGCVRNLTINNQTYNLGQPSISKNIDSGCQNAVAVAVSFGIDRNFLIAIIVCIVVLLILLLAVVVQRKQQNGWHEKDMDDIRETIINYEDEGGGERDTDYDLNVLRSPPYYEDKPYKDDLRIKDPNEVPDIGGFLVDKKDSCDRDSGAHPIDDVRHYAYEGDGNSTGSLSSLASCTDDGDLNFDYLSHFGPRFRKLADMYGEDPSDDDSNVDDDQGWRI